MTGFKSKRAMSDSRFGMVFEDPEYDEDGVILEEEFDEEDYLPEVEYNPFNTINS
jgi:hypothetical protein